MNPVKVRLSEPGTAEPIPGLDLTSRGPGTWLAAIWLFFLANPLFEAWDHRDELRGVLGIVCVLAFAAVYLALWSRFRARRQRLVLETPTLEGILHFGLLALLSLATVLLVGEHGLATVAYLGVSAVMLFPASVGLAVGAGLALVVLALGAVEPWGSQAGTAFGVLAATFAVYGMRLVMTRNAQLVRAHEANAALAVENERSRFARDLHDILGHSLTVITVKAELARRLLEDDPARARAELDDVERLSRDALSDVRRTVAGYREITLPGELARARSALDAADIAARVPGSAEEVPSELRELFAWTVREGVTNVIRHSAARACEIVLGPDAVEVKDDGRGPGDDGAGVGLTGLRERAAAADATVVTRSLDPGYSLTVRRR